jgi:hypothetical protein
VAVTRICPAGDASDALKLSKLVNPAQREYVGAMYVWEDVKMVRGL